MNTSSQKYSPQYFYFVFFIFVFYFFSIFEISSAQDKSKIPCPDFEFTKNFKKDDQDDEIYVLQQILNLDKRTTVALNGPGSKGNETTYFGKATREALKRFQALFIEYIEIADGKFNAKTRNAMNKVCTGPYFTGKGGNVFDTIEDTATNTDKISPTIKLIGPAETNSTEKFRITLEASEPIKSPTLVSELIIEGGNANDVRKISPTIFSFLVIPNEDVGDEISLQIGADAIEDLAGNKNEEASNELIVKVLKELDLEGIELGTTTDSSVLNDILSSITSTISTSTDCSKVGSISVYDYTNPCYGRAPMTDPNQNQQQDQQKQKDNSMAQMLMGLMQGLMSALGGMKDAGGGVGGNAACACSGAPTINFNALKGISGRQGDKITKGVGTGQFVGKQGPPPFPCGQMKFGSEKQCRQSCPGTCLGGCCNPQFDMTGMPVTGTIVN